MHTGSSDHDPVLHRQGLPAQKPPRELPRGLPRLLDAVCDFSAQRGHGRNVASKVLVGADNSHHTPT